MPLDLLYSFYAFLQCVSYSFCIILILILIPIPIHPVPQEVFHFLARPSSASSHWLYLLWWFERARKREDGAMAAVVEPILLKGAADMMAQTAEPSCHHSHYKTKLPKQSQQQWCRSWRQRLGSTLRPRRSSTLIRMDEPDGEEQIKAAEILRPRIVSRLTSSPWPDRSQTPTRKLQTKVMHALVNWQWQ